MKKNVNQLKIGVILSYINLMIGSIIPFVYTPVMLRILGQAEYGLYSLSSSTVGYLSLLNFGFGSTIIRYVAKYRAEDDKQSIEVLFGFFLLIYSFLSALVIVCATGIVANVNTIFVNGLTPIEINKMKVLVMIMAFNCALSFPLSVFSSMIMSYERYLYRKLTDLISTIITPILNLVVLFLGFASVGMAWIGVFMQFLLLPMNAIYCFRILNLKPQFKRISNSMIREIIVFSTFIFIGTIVDMLFWSTDKVILGMLASTTAVAIYNVGGTFNNIVISLSTSISGVLMPKITGMVTKDVKPCELTDLFIKVGRIQFIIIALIFSGFTVFGVPFIELWAGAEYRDSYWIAVLTMFPLCVPLIQNTGLSIITAQNKHRFRSVIYLVIAIANVISTYMIVPYYGVIGAAFCSCVSYLLGQGIIMNIYYYKVTKINIPLFWKNILKMSIIPIVMIILCIFLGTYISIETWYTFFIGVFIYTFIYAVLMYRYAMNTYEKDIFRKPIKSIYKKLTSRK